MSVITITAGTTATPDPSLGTDGTVTTLVAGGHANSTVADAGPGLGQTKSARWSNYVAPSGTILSITLKFDWAIPAGGVDVDTSLGGSGSASASFDVTLSVDAGSSFGTSVLSRSASISSTNDISLIESGSVSFNISAATPINQIQVRDRFSANATQSNPATASASVQASISNLRLEVTTANPYPNVACMM